MRVYIYVYARKQYRYVFFFLLLLLFSLIVVDRFCFELNGMIVQFFFVNASSEVIYNRSIL